MTHTYNGQEKIKPNGFRKFSNIDYISYKWRKKRRGKKLNENYKTKNFCL